MAALGEDFSGGWFRRLYAPVNPTGLWWSLVFAAALLALHVLLQLIFSVIATLVLFDGAFDNMRIAVKSSLIAVFPASLLVAAAGWFFAQRNGGDPFRVLSLAQPRLSASGWIVLIAGFILAMYLAIMIIVTVFGIDINQYTPGPDGQSPQGGSAGLVKEAMFDIANEPWLFALVFPSIALGAPIAEELIFRGQLFAALSQTRLGISGTTLVTSALWASMHMTEPLLSVGLIFIMGLLFGWMLYRFGSLWVTMACHAAWNAFYGLVIFASAGAAS